MSVTPNKRERASFLSGLAEGSIVMAHVVNALILREIKTRFGRHAGGYLWVLAEPVFYIVGLLLLKKLLSDSTIHDGYSAAHFASGILTFFLFRSVVHRSMTAVSGNRGLLMHPIVTPLDILLARTVLELVTNLLVICLIATGILAIWGDGLPAEPLSLLGILGVAACLGLSLGLVLGAAAAVWPVVERIVSPFFRFLFFVSGVFFVPASLPPELREVLLWNPVLHITEAARPAWIRQPVETYGTLLYPIAVAWLLLPFGLMVERLARSRIAPA